MVLAMWQVFFWARYKKLDLVRLIWEGGGGSKKASTKGGKRAAGEHFGVEILDSQPDFK